MRAQWVTWVCVVTLTAAGATLAAEAVTRVTAREANDRVQKKLAVLVDVREKDEVAEGMAKPARWVPLSKEKSTPGSLKEALKDVKPDREVIFYCASGMRADQMAQIAAQLGYRVANMGGFDAWESAGLPVRKP